MEHMLSLHIRHWQFYVEQDAAQERRTLIGSRLHLQAKF